MLQIRPPNCEEHMFKVLVIGDASTGKTSFIKRYVHQFFSRAYKATVGVDFAFKNIQLNDTTLIRLQLWDIAGQERFVTMTRAYYRDAVGAFIVFDVTNKATFESVVKWKQDLDNKVSLSDGSCIPCMLLANKCDLAQIPDADKSALREFAKQKGFFGFAYTSPKDNINIDNAVMTLVAEIYKKRQLLDEDDDDNFIDDDNYGGDGRQRRRQRNVSRRIRLNKSSFFGGQSFFNTSSCCDR